MTSAVCRADADGTESWSFDVVVIGGGQAAGRQVDLSIGTGNPLPPQRLRGRDLFWWLTRLRLIRLPAGTRGVTDVLGLYVVGLSWQHTRGSALLGFVADDPRHLAPLARRHSDDLAMARSRRSVPVDPHTASRGARSHGR